MCSCKGLAQCILVLFNFIFLQAGLVMFSFGIIAQVKPEYIFNILGRIPGMSQVPEAINLGGVLASSGTFMIIIGVIVSVVAFLGCCGAFCDSRELLIAYIVALVIVLVAQVGLIIFAAVAPEMVKESLQNAMNESMSRFKEDLLLEDGTFKLPNDSVSLGWTFLQIGASCCGTYNYTDYSIWSRNVTINGVTRNASVPISCCSKTKDMEGMDLEGPTKYDESAFTNLTACLDRNPDYINKKGCFESIFDLILSSRMIVIGIAAAIIAVELLLILLSAVACRQGSKRYY